MHCENFDILSSKIVIQYISDMLKITQTQEIIILSKIYQVYTKNLSKSVNILVDPLFVCWHKHTKH